jgi:hypothetical protein
VAVAVGPSELQLNFILLRSQWRCDVEVIVSGLCRSRPDNGPTQNSIKWNRFKGLTCKGSEGVWTRGGMPPHPTIQGHYCI